MAKADENDKRSRRGIDPWVLGLLILLALVGGAGIFTQQRDLEQQVAELSLSLGRQGESRIETAEAVQSLRQELNREIEALREHQRSALLDTHNRLDLGLGELASEFASEFEQLRDAEARLAAGQNDAERIAERVEDDLSALRAGIADIHLEMQQVVGALRTEVHTELASSSVWAEGSLEHLAERIDAMDALVAERFGSTRASIERLETSQLRLQELHALHERTSALEAVLLAVDQRFAAADERIDRLTLIAHEALDAVEAGFVTVRAPEVQAREEYIVYRVRPGETLWDIAAALTGSSLMYELIMEYNGLETATRLRIGQELRIPVQVLAVPAVTQI